MIKTVLLALSAFFLQIGLSQEYLVFPDSAASWVNSYSVIDEYPDGGGYFFAFESSTSFCANGEDTIISGTNYTKLNFCFGGYKGAFRDEAGQVFYVPADSTDEYILYDFFC